MNEFKVQKTLNRWYDLNAERHKACIELTSDRDRVLISTNTIVLDSKGHTQQQEIRTELCKELPQLRDLINSEPYLENLEWKTMDCIEIVFSHYNLVIEKIRDFLRDL